MDQETAEREVYALPMADLSEIARFYGPAATATILRALADAIEQSANTKRLH